MNLLCAHCCESKENTQRCARCKTVAYCSKECQKAHYDTHRSYCKERSNDLHRLNSAETAARDKNEQFIEEIQRFLPKLLSMWYVSMKHWNRRKEPLRIDISECRNKIIDIKFMSGYVDVRISLVYITSLSC